MSTGLPKEFENRIRRDLGKDADSFLRSCFDAAKKGIRFNPLKLDPDKEVALAKEFKHVPWEEHGYYYEDIRPGRSALHAAGAFYIQEPSAMAPVIFLDVKPGMCVLDLCAAPGGKSTQIASFLGGTGLLAANEPVRDRAKILSQNIERLGIRNALVISHDPDELKVRFPASFDRILVDAPCSGEGMMRRDETAVEEWSAENVEMCALRQSRILDAASIMLKPGGRLVYSTCTFSKDENEIQIERFLERHADFSIVEAKPYPGMRSDRSMLRIWPMDGYGEGHFIAVLERDGELTQSMYGYHGAGEPSLNNRQKQDLKLYREFVSDVMKIGGIRQYISDASNLFIFGKTLCAFPEGGLPVLSGLKVIRAGLELGETVKGRFIPAHSLAASMKEEDAMRAAELSDVLSLSDEDSEKALAYLNGQTIKDPAASENGWTLATISGISAGWVKVSNGILKNHYPKGLRIKY